MEEANNLQHIIANVPKNKWLITVKKHAAIRHMLMQQYPNASSLAERIYLFAQGLSAPPKCDYPTCENFPKWTNNTHYAKCCSKKCAQMLLVSSGKIALITEKKKATMIALYGVANPAHSIDMQAKRLATMKDRYGCGQSPKGRALARLRAPKLNNQGRKTIQTRYGVYNASQIPNSRLKSALTLVHRYRVPSTSDIPHVKTKRIQQYQTRWNAMCATVEILKYTTATDGKLQSHPFANRLISFTCQICNHSDQLPSETFKYRCKKFQTPCDHCTRISTSSRAEQQVADYISTLTSNELDRNNRTVIAPYELDIVDHQMKVAVEYCGLYWHMHSKGKDQQYHKRKLTQCLAAGYRLITIFEDEWANQHNIVCARLAYAFKVRNQFVQLYARKLLACEISCSAAAIFCNQHHIQGAGTSTLAVGLYDCDQLCSVITLRPYNGNCLDVYIIDRICSDIGFTIAGAVSKLFSKAVSLVNAQSVIGYSDNRWDSGNVYSLLGFEKIATSDPVYWSIDLKSLSRQSSCYNAVGNADGIWDCGYSVWRWSK